MKILLLSPPIYDTSRYGKISYSIPTAVPLGLGRVASVLEKAGYLIKVIDATFLSWEKTEDIIRKEMPDIIGITCMTEQRASAFKLVKLIKDIAAQIKVVLGGHHATFMYQQILAHFPVDAIVLGEGEITFLELVRAYENKKDLSAVKGIAYKDNNLNIVKTEPRELVEDLNSLPPISYHLFNLDIYPPPQLVTGRMKGKDVNQLKFSRVVASRGCFYNCIFCSTFNFWGGKYRVRSAQNIVNELQLLNERYKIGYINFADDLFTVKKDWVIGICKEIINRKLDIIWDCETRVDYVDYEMFGWMREAGCYLIKYGVESGSPEILRTLNKKFDLEQVLEAIEITRKAKIKSQLFLMVGNPGETQKTVNESISLIKKAKPDDIVPFITMVFPGTPLYEMCKSKGYIEDSFWLTDKPTPYLAILEKRYPLSQLRRWVDDLVCASKNPPERALRTLRNKLYEFLGIRFTRQGIEYWRDDRLRLKIKWRL